MQLSCITECISYCSCCYSQTPDKKQLLDQCEGFILAYDSEECTPFWHGRDGGRNGSVWGPGQEQTKKKARVQLDLPLFPIFLFIWQSKFIIIEINGKKLLEKNVTISLFLFHSPLPLFMAVALLRQVECGSPVLGTSTREEKAEGGRGGGEG